jgi:hypothetical protein
MTSSIEGDNQSNYLPKTNSLPECCNCRLFGMRRMEQLVNGQRSSCLSSLATVNPTQGKTQSLASCGDRNKEGISGERISNGLAQFHGR